MTRKQIQIVDQGFTAAMSPWAGDYADDYDWAAIRTDYNTELDRLAPEGVAWGWTEDGPWCTAELDVDADAVLEAWNTIMDDGLIDFETIATRHERAADRLRFRDHDGYTLTIPVDADGLTTADWGDGFTAAAWFYPAEGALFIPADCQADTAEHVEDGRAVGRWVEATTGDAAVIFDGAPRLF